MRLPRGERGVGLMEIMISIVIGMLLVLVIYQVYEISESQKRTITAGSDAQQNASYSHFVLGRDISMAGNGIASSAASLDHCAMLRPIPVLIDAGARRQRSRHHHRALRRVELAVHAGPVPGHRDRRAGHTSCRGRSASAPR